MNKKIPTYAAKVSDDKDDGIYAMSFVDFPAVERNFVALKQKQAAKLALNKHKQILTGAVLVPDMLIYRNQAPLGEYYMKFTAPDIERISQKMMKIGVALSSTTHQHDKQLSGNYLVELWIVEDPKRDKSVALGLGEQVKGTLMASYKIEDASYWKNEVLTGNVRGFSLEGFFNLNNVTIMNKQKKAAQKAPAKKGGVAAFLSSIAAMLEGETAAAAEDLADVADDDKTDSGEPYLIFELSEGGELHVDSEGFATIEGEQAPAGQHELSDGNFIVIGDDGVMVVTEDAADESAEAEAAELKKKEAKDRAKQFLSKAKKPEDSSAAKIKKLEAEIAKLKKQPSAPKAKPKADKLELGADAKFTDKVAAALSSRLERKTK